MRKYVKKWAAAIRYRMLGFSWKQVLLRAVLKFLRARSLYFYLMVFLFVYWRGYLPVRQDLHIEPLGVNFFEFPQISSKNNPEKSCNSLKNTIKYYTDSLRKEKEKENVSSALGASDPTDVASRREPNLASPSIEKFNQLTAEELMRLKGIGPVTAEAIIALRTKKGGFQSFEELLEVKGIGPQKLKKIMGEYETDGADK